MCPLFLMATLKRFAAAVVCLFTILHTSIVTLLLSVINRQLVPSFCIFHPVFTSLLCVLMCIRKPQHLIWKYYRSVNVLSCFSVFIKSCCKSSLLSSDWCAKWKRAEDSGEKMSRHRRSSQTSCRSTESTDTVTGQKITWCPSDITSSVSWGSAIWEWCRDSVQWCHTGSAHCTWHVIKDYSCIMVDVVKLRLCVWRLCYYQTHMLLKPRTRPSQFLLQRSPFLLLHIITVSLWTCGASVTSGRVSRSTASSGERVTHSWCDVLTCSLLRSTTDEDVCSVSDTRISSSAARLPSWPIRPYSWGGTRRSFCLSLTVPLISLLCPISFKKLSSGQKRVWDASQHSQWHSLSVL